MCKLQNFTTHTVTRMADSDDEYERTKARDKFRRERSDYDRRRDDRRRDWDHDSRSELGNLYNLLC